MIHHYAPTHHTYQLRQPVTFKSIDQTAFLERLPMMLGTFATILLSALFMRIILSLLTVQGPVQNTFIFITNPFVAPFNWLFPGLNKFVPISAMFAYCVYFALYWILAWVLRHVALPQQEPNV